MIGSRVLGLALAFVGVGVAAVYAEAPTKAGGEIVRPPEDLSTPQKALETYFWARSFESGEAVAKICLWEVPDPFQRQCLLGRDANPIRTERELSTLYAAAFQNDPAAQKWIDEMKAGDQLRLEDQVVMMRQTGKIEDVTTLTMDGEIAVLTPKTGKMNFKFKKVAGNWLLLPELFERKIRKGESERSFGIEKLRDVKLLELREKAYEDFKRDVKEKKFAGFAEAKAELAKRLIEASDAATTAAVAGYKAPSK